MSSRTILRLRIARSLSLPASRSNPANGRLNGRAVPPTARPAPADATVVTVHPAGCLLRKWDLPAHRRSRHAISTSISSFIGVRFIWQPDRRTG
jgi:hypothetical protein